MRIEQIAWQYSSMPPGKGNKGKGSEVKGIVEKKEEGKWKGENMSLWLSNWQG